MSLFLLAAALLAAAPPIVPVVPTARWTVDFATERCLATRDFTAGERRFTLGLSLPILEGDAAIFYLSVPRADAAQWKGVEIRVPGAPSPSLDLGDAPLASAGTHIIVRRLAEGASTALPAAARVELAARGFTATVPIDALEKLQPLLDHCERDLLVARGLPVEAATNIAVFPRPLQNVASLVANDDYPDGAIRNSEQGNVQTLLTIGLDGRVTHCRVTSSSGSALLDQTTCALFTRRARFHPAKDKAGKPIQGFSQARLRWVLPE